MRVTEKASSFRRRVTALREFSKYLQAMSESDYIIPTNIFPMVHRYTPYIFSDAELKSIFHQSDLDPTGDLAIPVVYRLIYLCGLRPNEGRELRTEDVDLGAGTLFIRRNKTHRERLIPMADDVVEMCSNYAKKAQLRHPGYFFPSPSGEPFPAQWRTQHFLRLWDSVKTPINTARVRVYNLRHQFATAVLMKWMDKGADLYVMLPYLSSYMGHAGFKDTAYYIHLVPERLRQTPRLDWESFEKLLPEAKHGE
jgi:integrase